MDTTEKLIPPILIGLAKREGRLRLDFVRSFANECPV
jgi:hypothetical protein